MSAPCRDALRILPALVASEPDVEPAVREHVAGCATCGQRVENARRVAAALRALPRVAMPAFASAFDALGVVVPIRDQDQLGSVLAAALPRLRLPETSVGAPSVEPRMLTDDNVRTHGSTAVGTGIEPVLRVALRAPSRTPGWLWARVRADLHGLREECQERAQVEHVSRADRSLQRWFHSGLAAAAALVLAVWFSSTLQAKVAEDAEPVIIHLEPLPLLSDQLPEAFHDSIVPQEGAGAVIPGAVTPGSGTPGFGTPRSGGGR